MARIRSIKPGVGFIHPDNVSLANIAPEELRRGEALVYRFIDAGGECIYVGVTESPLNRWQAHRRKRWWPEVAVIYYAAGMSTRRAWDVERGDIRNDRPRYNKTVRNR